MNGKQIKRIWKAMFLTQEKFAKLLGASKNAVYGWDKDLQSPNLQTQEKIFNLCKEKGIKWEE